MGGALSVKSTTTLGAGAPVAVTVSVAYALSESPTR